MTAVTELRNNGVLAAEPQMDSAIVVDRVRTYSVCEVTTHKPMPTGYWRPPETSNVPNIRFVSSKEVEVRWGIIGLIYFPMAEGELAQLQSPC